MNQPAPHPALVNRPAPNPPTANRPAPNAARLGGPMLAPPRLLDQGEEEEDSDEDAELDAEDLDVIAAAPELASNERRVLRRRP